MIADAKEARDRRIFDLWLACWTQQEIAEEVNCSVGEVNAIYSETASLPNLKKSDLAAAEHATDFDPRCKVTLSPCFFVSADRQRRSHCDASSRHVRSRSATQRSADRQRWSHCDGWPEKRWPVNQMYRAMRAPLSTGTSI